MKSLFLDFWVSRKILINGSNNRFLSFIGFSSILGISIGVMALIVVMSVMNGFHFELKKRILDATSHIEITGGLDDQDEINQLINKIIDLKHVKAVSPYVSGEGLLSSGSINRGVLVKGIDPQHENNVNQLLNKVIKGSKKFSNKSFEIIIGVDLARLLNVDIGDDVSLLIPKLNFSPIGNYPTIKKFNIVGIFDAGIYEFDSSLALIDYQDAQKIFFKNQQTKFSAMQIQLTDSNETLNVETNIKTILMDLNINSFISNWTNKNKNFFSAIQMEKRVMAIILTLIIAVAAFNLVASLAMSVQDRKKDIAILMTIGFSKFQIIRIFVFQGFIIGFIGSLLGLALGVLIASNINIIVPFIESLFNIQFLSKDIYYINELPSIIIPMDILFVILISIALSLIATIYPSQMAAKLNPGEILKNE
ncbi:lipoprotein-releasing ABC transporter permease subunit [Methylophilaceae bacterium]|jgi:lipoprotein-releasing system permease protein|nr:lipoprotein-releasing ABC transporter permease subunit [Methylophilaceae bacterium]NCV38338.1 lipoprotein-releasing ABC transporter permease subunit [Betaproteobacteria bacterium]NCX68367.1 lipoprotein-releasing ABC transporter permease subunit [Betaproteobacteria bacterium]